MELEEISSKNISKKAIYKKKRKIPMHLKSNSFKMHIIRNIDFTLYPI